MTQKLVCTPTTTTHTKSMSATSQLLLTRVQPNCKGRSLGSITAITTTTTTWTTTKTTTIKKTTIFHLSLTWFWAKLNVRFLESKTKTVRPISQQLLPQFWPNFKGWFLGSTTTRTTTKWTATTTTINTRITIFHLTLTPFWANSTGSSLDQQEQEQKHHHQQQENNNNNMSTITGLIWPKF